MSTYTATPIPGTRSDDRIEPGSHIIEPGQYPPPNDLSSAAPKEVATTILRDFNKALDGKDYRSISALFLENSYWRDHLCLSWDFRTIKGHDNILEFLKAGCRLKKAELDESQAQRAPQIAPLDARAKTNVVRFFIKVTTDIGVGQGVIRAIPADGGWKILTCFTSLKELTGHEEPRAHHRPAGVEHGVSLESPTWAERRMAEKSFANDTEPAVLIIGE
jgi:hypothetical protein